MPDTNNSPSHIIRLSREMPTKCTNDPCQWTTSNMYYLSALDMYDFPKIKEEEKKSNKTKMMEKANHDFCKNWFHMIYRSIDFPRATSTDTDTTTGSQWVTRYHTTTYLGSWDGWMDGHILWSDQIPLVVANNFWCHGGQLRCYDDRYLRQWMER